MDLFNELQTKTKELEISIKSLRQTGTNYAQAEKDYKVFLWKKKEQKQFVNALLSVKDVSVLTAELVKVLIAEIVLNEDRCMEIKYRFRHGDNLNYTDSFVAPGKARRDAGRRRKNG